MRSHNQYIGLESYAVIKIRFHARLLIKLPCFSCMEIEDIEQELMLDYLQRIQLFDHTKSTRNGFIAQIVEKRSFLLIREVRTKKRRVLPSYEPLEGNVTLISAVTTSPLFSWEEYTALAHDLEKATARLPTPLQLLCAHLKEKTITELCGKARTGKSAKYTAIRKIRQAFTASGLKQYV